MAQLSTDFSDSDHSTGSQPPDWTAQFGAALSAAKADFNVETDTSGSSFGDQICDCDYLSSGDSALSWDDAGSNADVDMEVRILWPGGAVAQRACGLIARGNDDSAGHDGYTVTVDSYGSWLKLYRLLNSGDSNLATVKVSPVLENGIWYRLRLQVNGTAIKVRLWKDGDSEPATWNIEETNAELSAAGWCGLYTRYQGPAEIDWFGVGTGGDAPPSEPAAEGDARVTQVAVEVLRAGDPDARVTQVAVEVLRRNRRNQGGTVVIVG